MKKKAEYEIFEALNPFFKVVLRGLSGLVDGNIISIRSPKTQSLSPAISSRAGRSRFRGEPI